MRELTKGGCSAFIRSQIQVSEEIKTRDLGGEISKTSELYEQYSAVRSRSSRVRKDLTARNPGSDGGVKHARSGRTTCC